MSSSNSGPSSAPAIPSTIPCESRGRYFSKKIPDARPLPAFSDLRAQLPSPILDAHPQWIAMYWKAWELAFRNFNQPAPGSGFVSQFIDAAFNENIFLWDTCFMTMFCNVAHPLVPGIQSLDNFYARQHDDGEISREIVRATGADYGAWVNRENEPFYSAHGWEVPSLRRSPVVYIGRDAPQPVPRLTLDALNNPLCAWAELESHRFTGDTSRLALVYPALERYYRALQHYLRQGNSLYLTDWASMDNSPRNRFLSGGGCAVDTSAQMVLFARNLAEIAGLTGNVAAQNSFNMEADQLGALINTLLWDGERQFYFDLQADGSRSPVKTVAAFWTLIAGVADSGQVDALCAELENPATFGRHHRVPTLAADQAGFNPAGGYWCGAVWAPTTTMVIRGLEQCGRHELARAIALEDIEVTGRVFAATGTLWENYSPDSDAPGKPAQPDFVGWTGIGPIKHLLEHAIGLKPDAATNSLTWDLQAASRQGCERYRFNGGVLSLIAEPASRPSESGTVTVTTDRGFTLHLRRNGESTVHVLATGTHSFCF
ncbi:MGH1-like glycoside hydrolase domain-containing protein [Rariglobus hedericola]|uniref:Alpha,alpha-trehalase n=1 Tax=Rariglobus hedericola TaxID=2597822 RepID=A0A556QSP3_9BACT|nr:trehalase family glycosidase [Rariglobus hedericola]TSJ79667.1 alpha,alpha-trehalase [Rariglobus hedericola]